MMSTQEAENEVDEVDPTLPWWRSALNLVVVALAIAVLSAGVGYVVGNNRALPDPNAVDTGFLQDMRYHHEQAVQISLLYINTLGSDPDLRTIAREIIINQGVEIGRIIQLLRDFGKPEANETDLAMGWMNDPIALDRMPGLASDADLARLRRSTGSDADTTFVTLMTAHHQGGIHMAEYAQTNAAVSEVRLMAEQMVGGQREEISELSQLLAASTS